MPANVLCEVINDQRPAFRAVLTGLIDGRAHVTFSGELDVATAPALRPVLGRLQHDGVDGLTITARDLTFMDSTGLSVLIAAARLFDGPNPIRLVEPSDQVRLILETTGVDRLFSGASES